MKPSTKKGMFALAVCAVLWSTAGVLIKIIPWHSMVICSLRSGIASLVLWLALALQGHWFPIVNRRTLMTGFFLGSCTACFVVANKLTTAANAIVLQSANPIFVLLICALFYHQRFTRRDLMVVFITILGVSMFFLDELSPGGLAGNLLALFAALMLAGTFIGSSGADSLPLAMSGVLLGQWFSFLLGLPFFWISPPVFEWHAVAAIVFLGVFQLGLAYALFSYGVQSCTPLSISLLGMLEPIFNPIWVAIFINEIPGPLALCGGVLVIVTLVLWCIGNFKSAQQPSL